MIDLIYEAAVDVRAWAAAMITIGAATAAPAMSLQIADTESKKSRLLVAPRTDPEWVRTYVEGWAASDW
jgi:hypothetical protein